MANGWKRLELLESLGTTIGNTLMQREKALQQRLSGRAEAEMTGARARQLAAYAERERQRAAKVPEAELPAIPDIELRELRGRGIFGAGVVGEPRVPEFPGGPPIRVPFALEAKAPSVIKHISDKDKDGEGRFKAQPWYVKHLWLKTSALMWAKSKDPYERLVLAEPAKRMKLLDPGDISAGANWLRRMELAKSPKNYQTVKGLSFKTALIYPEMQYVRAIHEQGLSIPKDDDGLPQYPPKGNLAWLEIETAVEGWKNFFAPKDSDRVIMVNRKTRETVLITPDDIMEMNKDRTKKITIHDIVDAKLNVGWEITIDERKEKRVPERGIWQKFTDFFFD